MSTITYQSESELASIPSQSAPDSGPRNNPWMINRLLDVIFVCGMAPWIFGALAYLVIGTDLASTSSRPQLTGLTFTFVVASFLIGESHQFTSILRYYFGAGSRTKGYIKSRIPIWVIYAGLAILAVTLVFGSENLTFLSGLGSAVAGVFGAVVILGMLLFPVVLAQHFCAQAKAVGLHYCRKNGYFMPPSMKSALSVSTVLLWIAGGCTIAVPFGFASLMPTDLAAAISLLGLRAGISAVLIFAVPVVARGVMRREWLPLGAALTWTNLALFMLLPFSFMIYFWLFVPVLFHASQHWAVAWDAQRQGIKAPLSRIQMFGEICQFVLPVQAVTLVVLFAPMFLLKLTLTPAQSEGGTLELTWSILVFYMHYFTDRIVWRPQIMEKRNGKELLRAAAAP